jgi:sRNA-binding carbon storage regulator CsrA
MNKTEQVISIAKKIAKTIPKFNKPKKPSEGNMETNNFMEILRREVKNKLHKDYSEQRFCEDIDSKVDFYIPDEKTIIEIALSVRNPLSEFHKDIFKALLAKDNGWKVKRLIFVAKNGAKRRHNSPLSRKVKDWLEKKHSIVVKIVEITKDKL